MEETLYTAGEIARIAGVSLRTIRFYDEKEFAHMVELYGSMKQLQTLGKKD